jgi:hypothetical protein
MLGVPQPPLLCLPYQAGAIDGYRRHPPVREKTVFVVVAVAGMALTFSVTIPPFLLFLMITSGLVSRRGGVAGMVLRFSSGTPCWGLVEMIVLSTRREAGAGRQVVDCDGVPGDDDAAVTLAGSAWRAGHRSGSPETSGRTCSASCTIQRARMLACMHTSRQPQHVVRAAIAGALQTRPSSDPLYSVERE